MVALALRRQAKLAGLARAKEKRLLYTLIQ